VVANLEKALCERRAIVLANRLLPLEFFKDFACLDARKATGFVARIERTWTPMGGIHVGQSVSSKRSRKRPTLGGDLEELAREITRLLTLEAPALRERWASIFGDDPSPNLRRALLLRAIAYRLQEKASARLKPSTQRLLDRIADNRSRDAPQSTPQRRASAGTVLIREWRGVSHRVTVLDHEVVYRDRRYRSLSEVARAITGSRWSGPLFFGLKGRAKESVNG